MQIILSYTKQRMQMFHLLRTKKQTIQGSRENRKKKREAIQKRFDRDEEPLGRTEGQRIVAMQDECIAG